MVLNNYLTGALNKARGLWKTIVCDCNYRLYHHGDAHGAEIHFWALDYNPAITLSHVKGVGVRHRQPPSCCCKEEFEGSGRCAGDARVRGFQCCLFLTMWPHCFTWESNASSFCHPVHWKKRTSWPETRSRRLGWSFSKGLIKLYYSEFTWSCDWPH